MSEDHFPSLTAYPKTSPFFAQVARPAGGRPDALVDLRGVAFHAQLEGHKECAAKDRGSASYAGFSDEFSTLAYLALELPVGGTVLAILQPYTQLFEPRANAVGQRELARSLEFAAHINKQSDEWLAIL